MKKWIVGIPLILITIYLLNLRSNWPRPSMGTICREIPQFENYTTKDVGGVLQTADLDSNKMAKEEMAPELQAATGSAVNFAGKYRIVNHECGLGCQKHAILDTNGKILFYGLQSDKKTDYKSNSSLIVSGNRYYDFKNKEMNYLCETKNNE